jgi:hypothetical protein
MRHVPVVNLAVAISLTTLLLLAQPALANECNIVSLEQVNAALPNYSPWVLHFGGPGGCRFEGQYQGSYLNYASLSFTQQFHPSKQAATSNLNSTRKETEKTYRLKPISLRGAEPGAFIYGEDANGNSARSVVGYVQVGRAILLAHFSPPAEVALSKEEEAGTIGLLQVAIADTGSPNTAQQASRCPYFDDALIRKLIPGKKITVEQFGELSCLAKNEKDATVMLSRTININPRMVDQIAQSTATGCTFEPVPALGEQGRMGHHCTSGNLRAEAAFFKDESYVSISVMPNAEPTAQQRADLVELARYAYSR